MLESEVNALLGPAENVPHSDSVPWLTEYHATVERNLRRNLEVSQFAKLVALRVRIEMRLEELGDA